MAEAALLSSDQLTVTETVTHSPVRSPHLVLKLHKPKSDKKVKWGEGTVDNEHMNKKKSKCCCIYEKPRLFGESSDEDDDDDCTGSCHGHKDKCYRDKPPDDDPGQSQQQSS